ncbi:MAG TPA: response regulator [Burkholderiaceae bacterium]|nr:response regulator [Burkholderiaceae bacterium]
MKYQILIVDDNALNRKLAFDLLMLENYDVHACEDANQALQWLSSGYLPDLVLMDIQLPGMDGLTLTRHLKSEPRFSHIPIVAMTAFAMKGDDRKAMDAGCSGYITKPIDTRAFPAQVAGFLPLSAEDEPPLNVMIVEDDRTDLKLAGAAAQLSGYLVLGNTTAEEAIHNLAERHPDVVLLDLNLPGIDGLTFVRLLRSDSQTRDLPVVAMTAYPDDYLRDQLLNAGCTSFLVKPVNRTRLLQALRDACRTTRRPERGEE